MSETSFPASERARHLPTDELIGELHRRAERDVIAVALQRDELLERLGRIRAAAESDPDIPRPLRDFLIRHTEPAWIHVPADFTGETLEELRK